MFTLALSHEDVLGLWIAGVVFVACVIALYFGLRHKATLAARPSSNPPKPHPSQHEAVPPVITHRSFAEPVPQKPEPLVMDIGLSSYPALSTRQLTQLVWMVLAFNDKGDVELAHLSTVAEDVFFDLLSDTLARMANYETMADVPNDEVELKELVAYLTRSAYRATARVFKAQVPLVERLMRGYHTFATDEERIQSIEFLPDSDTLRTLGNMADFDVLTSEELIRSCHWLFGFRGLGPAAFSERDQLQCLQDAGYALLMLKLSDMARATVGNIVTNGIYDPKKATAASLQLEYVELLIVHAEFIRDLHQAALSVIDLGDDQESAYLEVVPPQEFIESLYRIHVRMSIAALEAR